MNDKLIDETIEFNYNIGKQHGRKQTLEEVEKMIDDQIDFISKNRIVGATKNNRMVKREILNHLKQKLQEKKEQ